MQTQLRLLLKECLLFNLHLLGALLHCKPKCSKGSVRVFIFGVTIFGFFNSKQSLFVLFSRTVGKERNTSRCVRERERERERERDHSPSGGHLYDFCLTFGGGIIYNICK